MDTLPNVALHEVLAIARLWGEDCEYQTAGRHEHWKAPTQSLDRTNSPIPSSRIREYFQVVPIPIDQMALPLLAAPASMVMTVPVV